MRADDIVPSPTNLNRPGIRFQITNCTGLIAIIKRVAVFIIFLTGLISISGSALAQDQSALRNVPEQRWQDSAHGFSASLVITNKPEQFFMEWDNTPSERAPSIHTIDAARRGDTATGLIVFAGCKADKLGNCDAGVSFKVFRPDGSIYANLPEGELWKDKPALPEGTLQRGVAFLGFHIELDDPLGDYRIEAVVRDRFAGIELVLNRVLHVLPAEITP